MSRRTWRKKSFKRLTISYNTNDLRTYTILTYTHFKKTLAAKSHLWTSTKALSVTRLYRT